MRKLHKLALIATIVVTLGFSVGWMVTGNEPEQSQNNESRQRTQEHDFGVQWADEGSVELIHEFLIENHSSSAKQIMGITKSCGCLKANINGTRYDQSKTIQIGRGESVRLQLGLLVQGPGAQSQRADIQYSDGTVETCVLKVLGKIRHEVRSFVKQVTDYSGYIEAEIQIYFFKNSTELVVEVPRIEASCETKADFSGWSTIEDFDPHSNRPSRQLGKLIIKIPKSPDISSLRRVKVNLLVGNAVTEVVIPLKSR